MTAAPQPFEAWLEAFHAEKDAERALELVSGHTLTPRRHRLVVEAIRNGKSTSEAAEVAGVSERSVEDWLERGQSQARGAYHAFARDVEGAQALYCEAVGLGPLRTVEVPREYVPHPAQRRMHAKQSEAFFARILAACAGRRGGKTQAGAAQFAWSVHYDLECKLLGRGRWEGEPHHPWRAGAGKNPEPFLHYAVVAPTYQMLDEPKMALRRYLGRVEEGGIIVHQTDQTWWLVGGVRIDFRSGERPERLVGPGYDGVWFDEAARIKRDVWVDNMRPTLSDQLGWAIFTTTPLGRNWFYEEIWIHGDAQAAEDYADLHGQDTAEILDDQYAAVAWTTADNTAIPHLAEEMATARRQMPEAQFRRNYLASFDAFEGQCFDLVQSQHWNGRVRYTASGLSKLYAGLDLGQTHRTALVLAGMDFRSDWHELHTESASQVDFYGDAAWTKRDTDRSTWANRLYQAIVGVVGRGVASNGRPLWQLVPVFLPADRPDVKRAFRRAGFYVLDAYQEHEPAVTWVGIALHNGRLDISTRLMWRALSNLRYPAEGERSTKLWVDTDDDEWDALRYALSDVIRRGELEGVDMRLAGWGAR